MYNYQKMSKKYGNMENVVQTLDVVLTSKELNFQIFTQYTKLNLS